MANPQLIGWPQVTFNGGTSYTITTDPGTLIGDALIFVSYGVPSGGSPLDAGWTEIDSNGGGGTGVLTAYYRIATVNGSQVFNFSADPSWAGCGSIATLHSVSFFQGFADALSGPAVTWTLAPIAIFDFTGSLIVAFAADPTAQTWGLSPTLTEQMFSNEPSSAQMVGWYAVQASGPTSVPYVATKTGSGTSGGIIGIYFTELGLDITTGPNPTAAVGTPYSSGAVATGGQPGYAYAVTTGILPTGLSLNSSTGAITGTPSVGGNFVFEITVTDSVGHTAPLVIQIVVSGTEPTPPVGSPVAAHTFDFTKVYLSTRIPGAPGAGQWTSPIVLFDGTASPDFTFADTFSAGALTGDPTEPRGIICDTDNGLAFLGNGSPDVPVLVTSGELAGYVTDYWNSSNGAWFYNGNYYILTNKTHADGPLVMLRSTDGGVTWAIQDEANSPSGDYTEVALQRVDNKVCIFTPSDGTDQNFGIWEFDFATNTWSAMFAPINVPDFYAFDSQQEWANGIFKFPNGDFLVLYITSSRDTVCILWSATSSSWGTPNTFATGQQFANAIIDPNFDLVYLLLYDTISGQTTAGVRAYIYTHSTDSVGSIVTTLPETVGSSDGVGHPSIQGGQLFVPRDDSSDRDNAVWVADLPLATFEGGKEFLPIPVGESDKTPSCAYMMFPNGYSLTAIPLTLPCPLITSPAVVGQPFTETLIASGGTPPYTYGVAVGYALPPGLTLDPTTGIISGIPTAVGDFEIAYTVTDSAGNTAQTIGTCPIPIGMPGSPCANPVTNPALDSYLELRKVLVGWKKETHLPVRGKS